MLTHINVHAQLDFSCNLTHVTCLFYCSGFVNLSVVGMPGKNWRRRLLTDAARFSLLTIIKYITMYKMFAFVVNNKIIYIILYTYITSFVADL